MKAPQITDPGTAGAPENTIHYMGCYRRRYDCMVDASPYGWLNLAPY